MGGLQRGRRDSGCTWAVHQPCSSALHQPRLGGPAAANCSIALIPADRWPTVASMAPLSGGAWGQKH